MCFTVTRCPSLHISSPDHQHHHMPSGLLRQVPLYYLAQPQHSSVYQKTTIIHGFIPPAWDCTRGGHIIAPPLPSNSLPTPTAARAADLLQTDSTRSEHHIWAVQLCRGATAYTTRHATTNFHARSRLTHPHALAGAFYGRHALALDYAPPCSSHQAQSGGGSCASLIGQKLSSISHNAMPPHLWQPRAATQSIGYG